MLTGAAAVWAAVTVGFPRYRLNYGVRAVAPLLTVPAETDGLEVSYSGSPLGTPYVLTIELACHGRKDITADTFHGHQPLEFHVDAKVVTILPTKSEPPTLRAPEITVDKDDEKLVRVEPGRIGRRQKITISVLTDGEPSLKCCSPLTDVDMRERLDDNPYWLYVVAIVAGWTMGLLLAATAEGFASQKSAGWAAVAAAGAAIAAIGASTAMMILWISHRRKPSQRRRLR